MPAGLVVDVPRSIELIYAYQRKGPGGKRGHVGKEPGAAEHPVQGVDAVPAAYGSADQFVHELVFYRRGKARRDVLLRKILLPYIVRTIGEFALDLKLQRVDGVSEAHAEHVDLRIGRHGLGHGQEVKIHRRGAVQVVIVVETDFKGFQGWKHLADRDAALLLVFELCRPLFVHRAVRPVAQGVCKALKGSHYPHKEPRLEIRIPDALEGEGRARFVARPDHVARHLEVPGRVAGRRHPLAEEGAHRVYGHRKDRGDRFAPVHDLSPDSEGKVTECAFQEVLHAVVEVILRVLPGIPVVLVVVEDVVIKGVPAYEKAQVGVEGLEFVFENHLVVDKIALIEVRVSGRVGTGSRYCLELPVEVFRPDPRRIREIRLEGAGDLFSDREVVAQGSPWNGQYHRSEQQNCGSLDPHHCPP